MGGQILIKKIAIVGILLIFLGASVFPTAIGITNDPASSMRKIWYVDDDEVDYPGADFNTIQEAIDAAALNDEIRVYKGYYTENVVVDKKLTITGGFNGTSTIDGGGIGNTVKIIGTAPNVVFEKFTVTNSGNLVDKHDYNAGIHVLSGLNHISSNTITNNLGDGIYVSNSAGNEIKKNTISNNGIDGIGLFSIASGANIISENDIIDNANDGILILRGHSSVIQLNNISGNNIGIHLKRARLNGIENNFIGNSVSYGLFFEFFCVGNSLMGNDINGNGDHGIFLKFQCDGNTFTRNNFIGNDGEKSLFYNPHVSYLSCFLNGWRENYWDDYDPIIPNWWYILWGRWGFVPFPNFDLYPVADPYPWPPV